MVSDGDRTARAALARLAGPGDRELGRLVRGLGPVAALDLIRSGGPSPAAPLEDGPPDPERLRRWRARLPSVDAHDRPAGDQLGARVVCPGDPEWPTQLDDLADARPLALWVRGDADLRYRCVRSAAVVGARAATAYGVHVAAELAAGLAERDWTPVSGGVSTRPHVIHSAP